jgi:hypothetical protein
MASQTMIPPTLDFEFMASRSGTVMFRFRFWAVLAAALPMDFSSVEKQLSAPCLTGSL